MTTFPSKSSMRGFTLVEMLVVLTLMALVAGSITFVMMNSNDSLKAKGNEIAHGLRLTQMRAIREGQSFQVEIDLGENQVVFEDSVVDVPKEYSMTVKTTQDQLIEDDVAGMSFHADASSSGGYIILESDNERFEINVVWITGKIVTRLETRAA